MRYLFMCLMAMMCFSGPLRADDAAMRSVISSQIDAFRSGDLGRAFGFASTTIKERFGSPESFGVMVREGYPMVWSPAEVTFLDSEVISGRLWQRVLMRDAQGRLHLVEYQMIDTPDGWKINAVSVQQAPEGQV